MTCARQDKLRRLNLRAAEGAKIPCRHQLGKLVHALLDRERGVRAYFAFFNVHSTSIGINRSSLHLIMRTSLSDSCVYSTRLISAFRPLVSAVSYEESVGRS